MKDNLIHFLSFKEACQSMGKEKLKGSLGAICLESAASPVEEGQKRIDFLNRWVFQYLDKFPEFVFCAIEEKIDSDEYEVLGYILACPDSIGEYKSLDQSGLDLWLAFYTDYPAHLHINCTESARGKGVGSKLLCCLEEELINQKVKGLHLITAKGARNVGFYQKNSFEVISEKEWSGTSLLFLGKVLF